MNTIKIYRDNDAENPRDFMEHASRMAYKHRNYILGDEQIAEPIEWLESKLNTPQQGEYTNQRLKSLEERFFKEFIALPLYIYDHSGVSISTTPFSCQWDSSKVGYIYISLKDAREERCVKRITKKVREQILESLNSQVETYNTYLNGDVFRFEIENEEGENVDSCSGFYGADHKESGLIDYLDQTDFGFDNTEDFTKFINSLKISYDFEFEY